MVAYAPPFAAITGKMVERFYAVTVFLHDGYSAGLLMSGWAADALGDPSLYILFPPPLGAHDEREREVGFFL